MAWQEYAANLARFVTPNAWLLLEGERTNSARNPRAEGGASGSPGTAPTNWSISTAPSGTARTITTGITHLGMQGVRVRYQGTPSVTANILIAPEGVAGIAAANGQTWTGRFYYRVTGGGFTGISAQRLQIGFLNGSGTVLGALGTTPLVETANLSEVSNTLTASDPATANVQAALRYTVTNGVPMDLEFEVFWFTTEQGPFASTPILPAVGAPAVSTRERAIVTAVLASAGIAPSGACALIGRAMLPQNAPAGFDQMLCQVDDGTDSNRFRIRNVAGGATLVAGRVLGGTPADAASAGSITAGTAFNFGVSIDGAGRIASCFNGGAIQAAAGGPLGGLTTLRLGNNASGTAPMFGQMGRFRTISRALSDADLQAAVAAFTA